MGFLNNKRALVLGVVNTHSIAYGIAKCLRREGAEVALTYQGDRIKERVEKISAELGCSFTAPCDVSSDSQITELFDTLKQHWGSFDILVHSVAYAPTENLDGDYIDCLNREGFKIAHDISSYSFAALAKAALPFLNKNTGSLLTISYLGAVRVVPHYNVMGLAKASLEANVRYLAASLGPKGIRVNAISAGPMRTLAASAVKNLRSKLYLNEQMTPLRRSITLEDVGNPAAFLCSDLASGITGEILYVDAGFNIVGVPSLEANT